MTSEPARDAAATATLVLRSGSTEQTQRLGAALGRLLFGGETIALRGELGAGKTCFVRGLAAGMGLDPEAIASPTFVNATEHRGAALSLMHVDAWRTGSAEAAHSLGLEERLGDPGWVVAVEWPDRLGAPLPARAFEIELEHLDADEREIRLTVPAALAGRLGAVAGAQRRCRTCGKTVADDGAIGPFCSTRCRDADLGAWFDGRYRIGRGLSGEELDGETA